MQDTVGLEKTLSALMIHCPIVGIMFIPVENNNAAVIFEHIVDLAV